MNRYVIACRHCDGSGFHRGVDGEGNATLDACFCYRGRITIWLEEEDEDKLLAELQGNVTAGAGTRRAVSPVTKAT